MERGTALQSTALQTVAIEDLGVGHQLTDYRDAWELQRSIHSEVVAGKRPNTILFLEHPPTFTAGSRTQPSDLPQSGTPVIDVDRGGRITWHGPGQLVAYPIMRLPHPLDVVRYVRTLEDIIIHACAEVGLPTQRIPGRSGVWVCDPPTSSTQTPAASAATASMSTAAPATPAEDSRHPQRKVAAIGVRVSGGVTMHGFAVNCDCDTSWSRQIVPCGIPDAGVTTISAELGRTVTPRDVLGLLRTEVQHRWA